jgi:hypothetical protein
MAGCDLLAEITEVKRRKPKETRGLHYEFEHLERHWKGATGTATQDFYPIRTVTLLEVFTRSWAAKLIDHGVPYTERALELKIDIKINLSLVTAIQGRTITMGDLIAHNLPVNSFGQICGVFQTLLAADFLSLLGEAQTSRTTLQEMMDGKFDHMSPRQIITDADRMRRSLVRLFEVRNILCHELPAKQVYESGEIAGFLSAAKEFTRAADHIFGWTLYGNEPQTNLEMKIRAAEDVEKSEAELAAISEVIEADMDKKRFKLWAKANKTWRAYRQAEAACRADMFRGGTMAGLIWSLEEKALTIARLQHLKEIYPPDEA